ncbi:MAG TPA: prolyl oligopeptidase family serine peptidase, partial [Candidatus Acidoferrum sp.]|nr:prolyl oligopeptidase family serine peptidase [Candidatus Acidoferrum sp.]
MKNLLAIALLASALTLRADGPADNIIEKVRPVPPSGAKIPDDVRAELTAGAGKLRGEIDALRVELKGKLNALALLPDIEIFHKAVDWAVRYNEILNPTNELNAARAALKQGLERVQQLRDGKPAWISATGLVVRGYVSVLDGSVQPYGLVVPASFTPNSRQPWRLDFWFHGRDEKLTELNFLTQRQKSYGEFTPRDAIVLHPYSRFCNGQKLAGESDAFEALASVQKNYAVDDSRIVVRGFSLGGAACWHIAAHYPGRWAAAAPGAGFSETPDFLKVFQRETMRPTWYEQALWHQYNATDYALNFYNLPVVAYSGEIDGQKQAADMMARAMAAEGMELTHIIGPQTRHAYHPASKPEINQRIDSIVARGRDPLPKEIRFTTWTLRYHKSAWVTVDALDQHWKQARVNASIASGNAVSVQAENVAALSFDMPAGLAPFDVTHPVKVILDGSEMAGPKPGSDRSWIAAFHKADGKWIADSATDTGLRKRHGLQGPVDDAFMNSFLVVRPTGTAANEKIGAWVNAELARFTNEWRRHFRGDARVKDDSAITDADIANHSLILWGDTASNQLLAKIAPKLPIAWDAQQVKVGNKTFSSTLNIPVLIYPNPLNPNRYVVLNSGFTIREYDYLNNARQVPKLPDWAVIDISTPPNSRWPGKVADAGFFGERW